MTKPITGRLLVRIQSQEQMPRVLTDSGLFVDRRRGPHWV
nr:MAG TPA: hypothetical protein [Caudoviricetes sp.]